MKKLALLVLLAMSLIVVGCSDDDDDSGGSPAAFGPTLGGTFTGAIDETLSGQDKADALADYKLPSSALSVDVRWEDYTDVTTEALGIFTGLLMTGGYELQLLDGGFYKKTSGSMVYIVDIIDMEPGHYQVMKAVVQLDPNAVNIPTSITMTPAIALNSPQTYTFTYEPAGSNETCTGFGTTGGYGYSGLISGGATSITGTFTVKSTTMYMTCDGTKVNITFN